MSKKGMVQVRRAFVGALIIATICSYVPARAVPSAAGAALSSKNVEFVANIPDVAAIGARRIGNLVYVTTSAGLRIYDISLGIPVLQGALPLPHWENEDVDTNGKILLIASDQFVSVNTMLYVVDVSNPHAPILLSRIDTPAAHTASCVLDCTYAWLGGAHGHVYVVNLKDPKNPHNVGGFFAGGLVHDVQVDARGIAWVSTSSGLWAYKVTSATNPTLISAQGYAFHNNFIIHNSLMPNASKWKQASSWSSPITSSELLLVTEENWLTSDNKGCRDDGYFQTGYYRAVAKTPYIGHLASFHLGQGTIGSVGDRQPRPMVTCSSHYFGYQNGIAAVAWYEQGVRFLDVSKPNTIRQIGYWMPLQGASWSAMFNGQYIYVFDLVRGIDVLKFTGKPGDPKALASGYNTFVATRPSATFGWACRLPVAA